jgi:hypothetical protein
MKDRNSSEPTDNLVSIPFLPQKNRLNQPKLFDRRPKPSEIGHITDGEGLIRQINLLKRYLLDYVHLDHPLK